ncbi:MAG TPA: hypothetical protein VGX25_10735 [Actinophytocola sp.]|uniref:hypothetical protein n=1 Tax=Actinophytocola sp. TaxID=1872138 RepID=UPI002DDD43FE|nr:hypothetical protein [Actinophytocola sp.]HEV2779862.1 hypothetical protein [Actinophytocola sp.]
MDFWQTILVVFRRWYVALPAFLLSILLALAVYSSVPKVYNSTSVLVLTLPATGASQPADPDRPRDQTNPLLNFDKGLSTSAAILIEALRDPEIAAELGVPPGGDTWFEVGNGSSNPELLITGPFLFIQGNSATPEGARDIVGKVAERARVELANRQKEVNAPASTYITAVEVVPPTMPAAHGGSRIRAGAAAGALGILAGLAATFGFESAMNARRRRRRAPDEPAGSAVLERVG